MMVEYIHESYSPARVLTTPASIIYNFCFDDSIYVSRYLILTEGQKLNHWSVSDPKDQKHLIVDSQRFKNY